MSFDNEVIRISSADEEHMRMRLSLADLERNSRTDAALWALATCFKEFPHSDPMVNLEQFRDSIGWLNVSGTAPTEFTFEGQPGPLRGFNVDLRGKPVLSFPSDIHAVGLMLDVAECRDTRELLYHQIEQTIRGLHRVYRRLLAPFEDGNGRVVRVYYAVRWIIEPAMLVKSPASPW